MRIFTTRQKKRENKGVSLGGAVAIAVFWLAVWQIAAVAVDNSLLLPGPGMTISALGRLAAQKFFYADIASTLARCLAAMLSSFAAGILAAWAAYKNRVVKRLLTLPVGFFKAVPVMAIIIYVILLAHADWVAVIVCFLMCFPVVYVNCLEGLGAVSVELLEVARIYELSVWQQIKLVYVPGSMANIKAAVKLIAGLSWKAVVAAEVLSIPRHSLGYEMMNAKYYLETPNLFAYTITIVILSLLTEKLINILLKHWSVSAYEGSRLFAIEAADKISAVGDTANYGCKEVKPPRIELHGLSKSFEGVSSFQGLNATFEAGKVTGISGDSGIGKTTLVRIVAGLEQATDGNVTMSEPAKISYLFQEERLIPWLNVFDNMALGLLREKSPVNTDRIIKMAEDLEIADSLWKLPAELSGGMKHRAAIGRTFIAESQLMILDEPFRGLDDGLKRRILDRLWQRNTAGKTVLLITHSSQDAENLQEMSFNI